LINADTGVHPNLLNSRFGYVAVSRASHEATLFTNDMTQLTPKLSTDVSKSLAIEISRAPRLSEELEWTFENYKSAIRRVRPPPTSSTFAHCASVRVIGTKEEGQPKLATLFAFGCEPVTICAVGTILPLATVSPFPFATDTSI